MFNLDLIRMMAKYKLIPGFVFLIMLSVIAIISMIVSAHLIAEALTNINALDSGVVFVIAFYLFSNFLTILLEFLTQKTTADLTGALGAEYINHLFYDREKEENIQTEIAAKLTTQIERFRAENILPTISLIVRSIIVFLGLVYISTVLSLEAISIIALSVLLFAISYLLMISPIASFIDRKLSKSLFDLGAIVERIIKARTLIYFSDLKNVIGDNYERLYRQYGLARGLNGGLNLFPRQLIEIIAIGVAIFVYNADIILRLNEFNSENIFFLSMIAYKLYPQVTILIKNITTILMTKTAFPMDYPNISDFGRKTAEDDLCIGELKWNFKKNRVLVLTGASGSGKSSLAKEVAKEFNKRNLNVGFIDANGFVPFGLDDMGRQYSMEAFEQLKKELGVSMLQSDPSVWSNGQRQRLLIALSIIMDVDVIVLDEGLAALGGDDLEIVFNILQRTNIPLVLISHHLDFISRFPEAQIYSL